MPKASIIIRTKNEERWLPACLKMIERQTIKDTEVIIVDSGSTDSTLAIARRFGVKSIVPITEWRPGHAINLGIEQASGEYIVCLSAHCVPRDERWLEELLAPFSEDQRCGAVYGRQMPVAFTSPSDSRDLLITFGLDKRIQEKDPFFHNANSAFPRRLWQQHPFDATVSNIEDRLWAQVILKEGWRIHYEPEAAVYHHHGIHHSNEPTRMSGTMTVLQRIDGQALSLLPDVLRPEENRTVAVVPIRGQLPDIGQIDLLDNLLNDLERCPWIADIYVITGDSEVAAKYKKDHRHFISRPATLDSSQVALNDVLQWALQVIEQQAPVDAFLYANPLFPFRPDTLFSELIGDFFARGLDSVFAALADYSNYWHEAADGHFEEVGEGLRARSEKRPLYQALYGLGCITRPTFIRKGALTGKKVGLLPFADRRFSLKADVEADRVLINTVMAHVSQVSAIS